MKLVCSQSNLNTNLSIVSRAVPSRPTQPILGKVRLQADVESQQISLTAFDGSLGISTSFKAQVTESGDIALPAKLLSDIVSRLPAGDISLDLETEKAIVSLTQASGRYQVTGQESEEFPELPVVEDGEVLTLPTEALRSGLNGCLFAASTDDTKQILTGVHLKVYSDSLEFAATDGHRLAVVKTTNQPESESQEESQEELQEESKPEEDQHPIADEASFEVTVPARALRELDRIANQQKQDKTVALHFDQTQVVFELKSQKLTTRTLEGQYPPYHQLIPKEFQRLVTVEQRQMVQVLERINIIADQKNHLVKFSLDRESQQLTVSVDESEVGSGQESMAAQISGESLEMEFNVKYLLEAIKAIPSQELQMQLNAEAEPVILTPLGGMQMTCLVMPVQRR
ncbi:MAG: DNA polymerase III subunit beta [Hormoscilla sp. SP5CHS1]|nr:DNA polymerase III subunit beta [Hormoscilla sp. SP12CHS1]MBC6454063.1 DNA polymerase III subunit beta [Hormoscilla sp. SP5CHS1]